MLSKEFAEGCPLLNVPSWPPLLEEQPPWHAPREAGTQMRPGEVLVGVAFSSGGGEVFSGSPVLEPVVFAPRPTSQCVQVPPAAAQVPLPCRPLVSVASVPVPLAPALACQSVCRKVLGGSVKQTERALAAQEREKWAKEASVWCPDSSKVLKFGASSPHLRMAFRGRYGTLRRHWSGWNRVKAYCASCHVNLSALQDEVTMADFAAIFVTCAEECTEEMLAVRGNGPSSLRCCLASLRFLASRVGLPQLQAALCSSTIKGYEDEGEIAPLRQACALPLLVLVRCEVLLRVQEHGIGVRLFAGWMLCAIWASLRFCDAISIDPDSLSLQDGVLRGYCLQSKAKVRGMPFACLGRGLLAAAPEVGWAAVFLDVLATWRKAAAPARGVPPPFVLPAMSAGGGVVHGEPARYYHVSAMLRHVIALCGVPEPGAFSVHSMKVTMLAWTGQVGSTERDQRKNQGHHKVDVADLYGRDETLSALRVQLQVLEALSGGWKPRLAQERGAAQPLREPVCSHNIPRDLGAEYAWIKSWKEQVKSQHELKGSGAAGVPAGSPAGQKTAAALQSQSSRLPVTKLGPNDAAHTKSQLESKGSGAASVPASVPVGSSAGPRTGAAPQSSGSRSPVTRLGSSDAAYSRLNRAGLLRPEQLTR